MCVYVCVLRTVCHALCTPCMSVHVDCGLKDSSVAAPIVLHRARLPVSVLMYAGCGVVTHIHVRVHLSVCYAHPRACAPQCVLHTSTCVCTSVCVTHIHVRVHLQCVCVCVSRTVCHALVHMSRHMYTYVHVPTSSVFKQTQHAVHAFRVGQNHIYTRCINAVLGRDFIQYAVRHSVCIRFWLTLHVSLALLITKRLQHPQCLILQHSQQHVMLFSK